MPAREGPPEMFFRRSCDWVRRWWYGLNLALLVCAVGLALWIGSRLALVLIALVPLVFVPFSYARLRLHRSLVRWLAQHAAPSWTVLVLTGVGCVADCVTVVQLLTARSATLPIVHDAGAAWIGPVWFSAHTLLLLGYGCLGLARLVGRTVPRLFAAGTGRALASVDESAVVLGRRQFLQQFGLLGAGAPFIVSLSSIQLSYDFRVEEREIWLPHWPKALDGLRVAHLSDIHVGGAMNRERVLHVAALTNAARPDIVLHTGDFLTHRSGDFDAPLYEALARIHAPYGQWASLGNHDFDDPARLARCLRDAGVTVLRNRVVPLVVNRHPLEVGGIDFVFWRANRTAQYAQIVNHWPARTGARLLLNHDPGAFRALPSGCADLVLSGHMHGGQIGIQLGPSHAVTVVGLVGIPDQGLFSRSDDVRLYVTRCVGFYGYPMRLGIPPEIALLTVRTERAEGAVTAART
jgi:predicted MPP superfamily phosphohydrolase